MSTKKVPLADALWQAANEHLAVSEEDHNPYAGVFHESCCAALEAVSPHWYDDDFFDSFTEYPALVFLKELGCDLGTSFFDDEYPLRADEESRQGARYMWLLLAMHVAEDEGIEIEVEA